MRSPFLALIALISLSFSIFAENQAFITHFNQIKRDPNALYTFFHEMPKGGELHYHLAGGAYPEAMLALIANQPYCLDKLTLALTSGEACTSISSKDISANQTLYANVIRAWSMKNFIVTPQESGHDHFFSTFLKFIPVMADNEMPLLADVIARAAEQHEHYLEVIVLPDNARSANISNRPKWQPNLDAMREQLMQNKAFTSEIERTIQRADTMVDDAKKRLHCDTQPNQSACHLTVKLQYYVLRAQPLDQVFAQALHGFAAASKSKTLVAVNLVQAEDDYIPLRDYKEHMRIFAYLHRLYPSVHIALHAGELAPTAVQPSDLRFHIRDAILVGGAERIGHGVDIAYENKAQDTLNVMKARDIPVEINLTSNESILNIKGKQSPLHFYLKHGIPLVLSTDDEGILRTDLTREYVKAVLEQHLDYPTIRHITRNVLTYNFLPGKSVWTNAAAEQLVPECQDLNSKACLDFVNTSEKAKLQRELELALLDFEKRPFASL